MFKKFLFFTTIFLLCSFSVITQSDQNEDLLAGLKFRSIGPAFMSGRIADIAIDPKDDNKWYVAVGSGGVWKTSNAGVTWKPIFDNHDVYSTGCIAIDPSNSNTIWLGTGENVGGRHASWGDGVYLSKDTGASWENMGLKDSEHISKIIVHPNDPNTLWVASQGPLWSKGGSRGIFKSSDGGKTWKHTLGDKEWTGATDLLIDSRNPDRLYAATWQRHRTVGAYLGGGPNTAIHKSEDGGITWSKLTNGLPNSNMGKIGLAISPQQPDVVYAAIELDLRKGGVYKSSDRGTTWEKQSDAVSGATGPHYYQELYACPHNFDRLYLVDVRIQVSDNGGKNFRRMKEEHKHSDNHALAFRKDDPEYLLVGTDGGIYESFDLARNWRYMANLPLTQFYKIAVDDAKPFYNIYGGTQDNSTEGGPSRTDNAQGIQNSDWRVVLNWDGHQPATEPGNPNIVYGQRQQGTLSRIDMQTGEVIDIQPQAGANEDYERFNWDAPILVSPYNPTQIFFASQRLWRSNDRGDSWTALSGDLTRNESIFDLPMMGKIQSWDNAWDLYAMSNYNTITSIAESPKQRNLIYIGTDDGLIHTTSDGGSSWKKLEVNRISGVPKRAYVNDIKADLFDQNVAYAVLDNHKEGDYNPYIIKTIDQGKSWKSIKANLPNGTIIWRIVQDHIDPNLLFIGTEFGIYYTSNGGSKWTKLKAGLPTISFRDLQIQRREGDLVAGSFGRGIYILDDYTSLRDIDRSIATKEKGKIFPVRDTWWYIERPNLSFDSKKGSMGAAHFVADNPEFGACFTYYLDESIMTQKEDRQKREKDLTKQRANIPFPGWETLDAEMAEDKPIVWFIIKNANGDVVRKLKGDHKKGVQRINWDLRYPNLGVITNKSTTNQSGLMAPPGEYSVEMFESNSDGLSPLGQAQTFTVKQMHNPSLETHSINEASKFWRKYEQIVREQSVLTSKFSTDRNNITLLKKAYAQTPGHDDSLISALKEVETKARRVSNKLNGSPSKRLPGARTKPTLGDRMFAIVRAIGSSTYGPTKTNIETMNIIKDQMGALAIKQKEISSKINEMQKKIVDLGGPYVEL